MNYSIKDRNKELSVSNPNTFRDVPKETLKTNESPESKSFEEVEKRMMEVTDKIVWYLGNALMMVFQWKNNPDMLTYVENIVQQRKKWDINSGKIFNTLWGFEELFRKYWKNELITEEYMECLFKLKQAYSNIYKYSGVASVITTLNSKLWAGIENIVTSLDTFTNKANSESMDKPHKLNTWSPFIHNYS